MPTRYQVDPKAINRWTGRFIPVLLMGCVAYATYVHVVRLCVNYLLKGSHSQSDVAITLLVLYFVLFFPMSITYFRLLYIVTMDPGFVPFGPAKLRAKNMKQLRPGSLGREYASEETAVDRDTDADSPGLEEFYTKDVFVCEGDGRPKWCSECANWKPDRSHHSRDVGRCVRKFDHFCPWVGGVVAENSFKFFIQFVFYTCLYCTFLLVVMAFYIHDQMKAVGIGWDKQLAVILGLASFFGLFTFGMTCSSGQFTLANLTTVENLNKNTITWQLAVLVPRSELLQSSDGSMSYNTITYPLPLSPLPSETNGSGSQETQNPDAVPHGDLSSERDSKATRSFAILELERGTSPWDLGPLENWKSVMGDRIFDWFLPLKRSPCCNHEDGHAQYATGQWLEHVLADQGFITENQIEKPRPFRSRPGTERKSLRMNRLKPLNAEAVPVS